MSAKWNMAVGDLSSDEKGSGARDNGYKQPLDLIPVSVWAKGMRWSVPLGCALRHVLAMLEGEALDPESGEPHLNHVYCNVIMLQYFARHYPDGDDRPIFKAEQ
jgi:hypothetical protein